MADVKPETHYRRGVNVKFQRNPHIICIGQHSETDVSTGRRQGGWKIKDSGLEAEVDMK